MLGKTRVHKEGRHKCWQCLTLIQKIIDYFNFHDVFCISYTLHNGLSTALITCGVLCFRSALWRNLWPPYNYMKFRGKSAHLFLLPLPILHFLRTSLNYTRKSWLNFKPMRFFETSGFSLFSLQIFSLHFLSQNAAQHLILTTYLQIHNATQSTDHSDISSPSFPTAACFFHWFLCNSLMVSHCIFSNTTLGTM